MTVKVTLPTRLRSERDTEQVPADPVVHEALVPLLRPPDVRLSG